MTKLILLYWDIGKFYFVIEQALFLRTSASSAKCCTEAGARRVAPQADSDGSGHDMVWLDLSARY